MQKLRVRSSKFCFRAYSWLSTAVDNLVNKPQVIQASATITSVAPHPSLGLLIVQCAASCQSSSSCPSHFNRPLLFRISSAALLYLRQQNASFCQPRSQCDTFRRSQDDQPSAHTCATHRPSSARQNGAISLHPSKHPTGIVASHYSPMPD